MIICKVTGNVWATRKEETLNGLKLMVVRRVNGGGDPDQTDLSQVTQASFIAVDCVGAGVGDTVLIVTGSSARKALANPDTPVDAAIVGIIDGGED